MITFFVLITLPWCNHHIFGFVASSCIWRTTANLFNRNPTFWFREGTAWHERSKYGLRSLQYPRRFPLASISVHDALLGVLERPVLDWVCRSPGKLHSPYALSCRYRAPKNFLNFRILMCLVWLSSPACLLSPLLPLTMSLLALLTHESFC